LIRICKATNNDIREIIQIQSECRLSSWSEKDYIEELKRSDSIALTAKQEEIVIGFLVGRLIMYLNNNSKSNNLNSQNEADIYNIGVKPKHRRKGIGNLLLNEFKKTANRMNINTIWLEVRETNLSAIEFYKNNGFHVVYSRKNFYTFPTENAFIMKTDSEIKT